MNEHFRVAHKLGLMFRPDEALPRDIKSWAIKQLRAPSPVLGTETVHSEIKPWPKSLQPNLEDRAAMMRLHWENTKKRSKKLRVMIQRLQDKLTIEITECIKKTCSSLPTKMFMGQIKFVRGLSLFGPITLRWVVLSLESFQVMQWKRDLGKL